MPLVSSICQYSAMNQNKNKNKGENKGPEVHKIVRTLAHSYNNGIWKTPHVLLYYYVKL